MHISICFSFACPAYAETASCRQAKSKVTKEKGSTKKGLSTPAYRTGVNAWQAGALPHPSHIPESLVLFVHNPFKKGTWNQSSDYLAYQS